MKFIITESKLDRLIRKNLDEMFDVENINWTNPYKYDFESGEEYDDPDMIVFYYGDYSDDEMVFQWYSKDYWGQAAEDFYAYKENSPIIQIEEPYHSRLNGMFSNKWYQPFKEWFQEKFEMPVKTITDEIHYKRK